MSALQAIPTQHGLDILNSEFKATATKYKLVGALTHDAASGDWYSFYHDTIETSYFDENGVLTFILNLPIETHFDEYLHQIQILDDNDQAVVICDTPKVALAKGIGGMVTLKAAITGSAGEVVFKSSEFVTETELQELHLAPIVADLDAHKNAAHPHQQYVLLESLVGLVWESHHAGSVAGWIDLKGGEFSRTTDKLLWDYANDAGMVVLQSTKNGDPMRYAMYFGDGDGSTTFTVPNHHLGHFVRGNPSGTNHGETQSDAIRNITGQISIIGASAGNANGVFERNYSHSNYGSRSGSDFIRDFIGFDASHVVPTADENRPYTANLTVKIHRGWM